MRGVVTIVGREAEAGDNKYPYHWAGSDAGEILDTEVNDHTIALTAIHFAKAKVKLAQAEIEEAEDSESVGKKLASSLDKEYRIYSLCIFALYIINLREN